MNISGVPLDDFQELTGRVSRLFYGGNVVVARDAHELSATRCVARLRVFDSRGEGARRSWSGRRMPAACWHAYRDVLTALFERYPNAVVRTGIGKGVAYRGKAGFLATYPDTADCNIGSQLQPATMPELCECDGNVPRTRAEHDEAFTRAVTPRGTGTDEGYEGPALPDVTDQGSASPDAPPNDVTAWLESPDGLAYMRWKTGG